MQASWLRASCFDCSATTPCLNSSHSSVYLLEYFPLWSLLDVRHYHRQYSYLYLQTIFLDWGGLVSHSSHASSNVKDGELITFNQFDCPLAMLLEALTVFQSLLPISLSLPVTLFLDHILCVPHSSVSLCSHLGQWHSGLRRLFPPLQASISAKASYCYAAASWSSSPLRALFQRVS